MPPKTRSPFKRTGGGACFKIVPRNDAGGSSEPDAVDVLVYDYIGFGGVEAKAFTEALGAITAKTIHLRINSPGGSVFDALAMMNALRAHPASVVTHIDGLAASAASFLALAGDEVRMADNAFLMIHNPWTLEMGDANQLRKTADTLDKIAGSIKLEYTKKTGLDDGELQDLMDEETWFTADEAKRAGFVDVIDNEQVDAEAEDIAASFDLSIFQRAPAALMRETRAASKRDVERALRDAGFSRSQAKAIAALAPGASTRRDADDDASDDALRHELTQLVKTLTH